MKIHNDKTLEMGGGGYFRTVKLLLSFTALSFLLLSTGCRNIFLEDLFRKDNEPGIAKATALKIGPQNANMNKRFFSFNNVELGRPAGDYIPVRITVAGKNPDVHFLLQNPKDNTTQEIHTRIYGEDWEARIPLDINDTRLLTITINAGRPDADSFTIILDRQVGSADNVLLQLKVGGKAYTTPVPAIIYPTYAEIGYPAATIDFEALVNAGATATFTNAEPPVQTGNRWTAQIAVPNPGSGKQVALTVTTTNNVSKTYVIQIYRPASYYVRDTGNDENSGEIPSSPFKTFKKALDVVNAPANTVVKTVTVIGQLDGTGEPVGGGSTETNSAFVVSAREPITISGMSGGTLTAPNGKRVVRVASFDASTSSNVTFAGITISGANTTNDGGGVYVDEGAEVTVGSIVSIKNNTAKDGGGMYVKSGGKLTLTAGMISNNTATNDGGGIYIAGGTSSGMTAGTLLNNTATANGGGIYIAPGASFAMNGGEALLNRAGKGGGVYNGGTLTMKPAVSVVATISGNSIIGGINNAGGGIYQDGTFEMGERVLIENGNTVKLAANRTVKLATDFMAAAYVATITPYRYIMGTQILSEANAGKIADYFNKFRVAPDGFNPFAIDDSGKLCSGMYYVSKDGSDTNNNGLTPSAPFKTFKKAVDSVAATNIKIIAVVGELGANESGYTDGTSLFVLNGVGVLTIKSAGAGAEFKVPAGTTKRVFHISGNSNVTFEQVKISGGNGQSQGGGIYMTGTTTSTIVTLGPGTEISGNKTTDSGGQGGGIFINGASLTLSAGVIKNNQAYVTTTNNGTGGGIYMNGGAFSMVGGVLGGTTPAGSDTTAGAGSVTDGNRAGNAGGMYIKNATVTLGNGALMQYNKSTNGGTGMGGGGVYAQNNSFLTINSGAKIVHNAAANDGGGIYMRGDSGTSGTILVNDGEISYNTSKYGGGIYPNSTTHYLYIRGGRIIGNKGNSGGGGVFNRGITEMTGGEILNNQGSPGSAVYQGSGTLTIKTIDPTNNGINNYITGTYNGNIPDATHVFP